MRDRLLRLGLPFVVVVTCWIPLAYYAAWRLGRRGGGYPAFWARLARRGREVGPTWFIWLLLAFGIVAAAVRLLAGDLTPRWQARLDGFRRRPALAGVSC